MNASPRRFASLSTMLLWAALCATPARGEPVPLDIQADRLELDRKAGLARFEGNVEARQGDFVLRCARLTATYGSGGEVETVRVEGGLSLAAEGFAATAQEAALDRRTGEMVLTGRPEVVRGDDRLTGERVRFWPESGRLVVEAARGRVRLPSLRPPARPAPASGPPGGR